MNVDIIFCDMQIHLPMCKVQYTVSSAQPFDNNCRPLASL